ncbi:hypothetical protein [Salinibacillus xinjiangensis]|uniref:Atypical membrane-integrating protein (Mistic protein) n=1 Tax=Salinibacillus xinjiangensis TaxID=1229268 RepID=A0A6G1X4E7_9BACI|nr:hypothetical protein [Salinibacillus xinjiangensis]MRG85776.1 hypothetical protein [Salinibacillus xinjiangensis]
MKATDMERKRFDKALDEIIDLFNNLESDVPIIQYSDEVLENIERAKKKYGEDMMNERINKVVGEMLSWLDLDDVDLDEEEEGNAENEEEEDETE